MKLKLYYSVIIGILFLSCNFYGQNVTLYKQFNGRYDFTFIGNTLNTVENGFFTPCIINTSSSALLNLNPNDVIEKAYLYWAGSGTGDFNIKLNNQEITAERTFSLIQTTSNRPFFSAFKDVTSIISTIGNGIYTISELDLSNVISPTSYCDNGTNFGGWAIVIVYKNGSLPLNQLNIYDGLQAVPNEINITLTNLNVIDNQDAKIGFVAWEGDKNIAVNETLRINGNIISNPPLNPSNNAFNGTNSITGSDTLYNMDLDVYNIQNNIQIGDTSALIQLTSGQDFVMINTIVTKLNSQLPDATIKIDKTKLTCDSRVIDVEYTVYNSNSTDVLPSGTSIAIYANNQLLQTVPTPASIPIDGNIQMLITLIIPSYIPDEFILKFVVDDNGLGQGSVTELIENNNDFTKNISLQKSPAFNNLDDLLGCNEGFGKARFDFSVYSDLVKTNLNHIVTFYETQLDASIKTNPILNTTNYITSNSPKKIFIRIENENCFSITSFDLKTRNCPPTVYNFVSPNNDNLNDTFFISGLRDIFLNYKIEIYNRWGKLIWTGNNNTKDWDGYANHGTIFQNDTVPSGTYYYIIYLNDNDYPTPLTGYLYLSK